MIPHQRASVGIRARLRISTFSYMSREMLEKTVSVRSEPD